MIGLLWYQIIAVEEQGYSRVCIYAVFSAINPKLSFPSFTAASPIMFES